jgi:hypothetical protein
MIVVLVTQKLAENVLYKEPTRYNFGNTVY